MSKKQQAKEQSKTQNEFEQFELLTKNLLSVSNAEVREKMKEEKRKKKTAKRKVS